MKVTLEGMYQDNFVCMLTEGQLSHRFMLEQTADEAARFRRQLGHAWVHMCGCVARAEVEAFCKVKL